MGIENLANMMPSQESLVNKVKSDTGVNPVINQVGRMFNSGNPVASNGAKQSFTPVGSGTNGKVGIGGLSVNSKESRYRKCGWVNSDLTKISSSYKIVVSSSALQTVVIGILQGESTFMITSEWGSFIPIAGLQGDVNSISQFFTGKVLMTQSLTRRIWKGTSPISITVDFVFQSITDSWLNVVWPVQTLGQLVLPGTSNTNFLGQNVPLLTAPGPSPFQSSEIKSLIKAANVSDKFTPTGLSSGDTIHLKIGKFLSFPEVIVKRVIPTFDNKMDKNGLPISAKVSVEFETYEIITKTGQNGKGLDSIFGGA